ncbi:MAG: arginyl-tRNA synthetase [Gaiellaceae bacterium]|nr:arginyl-tRNA synthetase [Gaiellaceae bacterium]
MPADPVSALEADLAAAVGSELTLERPAEAEHGDYATNAAMRLAGTRRRAPREIAEEIAAAAAGLDVVERAEIAGPGFVNVFLRDEWFVSALEAMLAAGPVEKTGKRVQVELVSANPTGPITVASARNGAYGDAVARLLEAAGNEVEREYYYNDAGAQMDKFRASVDAVRRGEEPPEDGYHGDYLRDLVKSTTTGDDPVAAMRASIEASLERFRIHIDTWRRQSVIEYHVPEVLAAIEPYAQDGAVWAPTTRFGDDKDRVVVRSDGSYTYFAADIAYVRDKLERGFDTAMYVLGADHHGYVARLRAAAGLLGYDPERVEVLIYQLVSLTKGGEATKMSKRRGDVVFLDELIDEVGVDAARWYLVNRGPDQSIEIDIDLAAERSQKNPVYYVQYAHARISGILRNAPENAGDKLSLRGALVPEERELVKRLADLPGVIADAAAKRGPQIVPNYAIRVADDFHRFYHEHRVLESEQQEFRLALCRATQTVIARCLDLVGVEAPDRM